MIGYLKGELISSTSESVLLEVNGVGFEIYCSGAAQERLMKNRGGEVYTYLQMSENTGITLFGFDSLAEKEVFLKLITVSGVGAKSAIGILTSLSASELSLAIANADVKRLTSVKGLGRKTAEKIVLELHGKISASELMEDGVKPSSQTENDVSKEDEDALSALMNLGFTRGESVSAIKKAKNSGAKSVEEVIRLALSGM